MRKPSTYLLIALSSFALLLVVFLANAALLFRAGEIKGIPQLVAEQQQGHAIVNTLYASLLHYKYETYRTRRPEIVAIGSSRAMQFRAYHFTRPFYNLGGVDSRPEQYLRLYENLLRPAPPNLAIVVIDFWNYCGRGAAPRRAAFAPSQIPSAQPGSIVRLPAELLIDGKLSPADYLTVLRQGIPVINELRFLGVTAGLRKNGFADDGSRYTFVAPFHERGAALAARWREVLERIATNESNFRRGCTLDRGKVDRLLFGFVERLRGVGIDVVLMFAPMPAVSLEAMAAHGDAYSYIGELRRYVAENAPVPVFDYHDGRTFGSPDCEFRDGFHGGEITYMRMLVDAAGLPGSPLAEVVDLPFLERAVTEHPGRLTIGSRFIQRAMADYFRKEAGAEGCADASFGAPPGSQ